MENRKTDTEELMDRLFYKRRTRAEHADGAFEYAEGYKKFISSARTERAFAECAELAAIKAGFRPIVSGEVPAPGEKVYYMNRGKSMYLAVMGRRPATDGLSITAAHIDCPRIDLKPVPLYEDSGLALFKTHYYGGIKKYQWTAIPLELTGVVILKDGSKADVSIGADESDPVFVITDILPHLAKEQYKKPLSEAIAGEALNAIAGSLPYGDGDKDSVRLNVIRLLNEKYGITEEDFLSAELTLVPALPVRDVGLDRGIIGAYGHDDRCCAYPALTALTEIDTPEYTAVCVLADKEEIGSEGVTGMQSGSFELFVERLCGGADGVRECFSNSVCLSADVCNAFDPTYASVSDKLNNARLGAGVSLMKYTGHRGKSESSDASAELMGRVRALLDGAGVAWQTGELGAVDEGGGGTVAMYMAKRNIDVVDIGVPVLSMHAPYEQIAKTDLYEAFLACRAFYGRNA